MLIYPIPIAKPRTGAKRKLHKEPSSPTPAAAEGTEATTQATDCVSYVVETRELRGKFLVDKAKALGVPMGKLCGQLHSGKDVTLPDGRVVKSSDCVSPPVPATGCAVVACPSTSYVDELVASSGFARYLWDAELATPPTVQLQLVYHLGDIHVLSHPKYVEWTRRFGADVEHVVLNHAECNQKTVYRASALLQAQLHSLFPQLFPPNEAYEQRDPVGEPSLRKTTIPGIEKDVVLGESMLRHLLTPLNRRGMDLSSCWPRVDFEAVAATTSALKEQVNKQHASQVSGDDEPAIRGRITFLGTGCAIPSKYRNVTGMYLELEPSQPSSSSEGGWAGMMLDCGEGSYGQLYRYTGGDRVRLQQLVDKLKLIWVSHNHADHHLGILRMLSARSATSDVEPLLIIGPTPVDAWLREYSLLDPTVAGKYTFVDSYCFDETDDRFEESIAVSKPTRVWLKETLGITSVECIPVKHSHLSYALVATFEGGDKIAFSGDCRPSDEFAAKADGALLMVHEATFEESMSVEAKQKAHSTTAEAIDVGRRAHAKHVALTHFSQRYPKMPVMEGSEREADVLSALDLLTLDLRHLRQPGLAETCAQLMAEDDEDDVSLEAIASTAGGQ